MQTIKRYLIEFSVPRAFFSENVSKEVKSESDLTIKAALKFAQEASYSPIAFRFVQEIQKITVLDGETLKGEKKTKSSGWHFINGKFICLKDVPPSMSVLRSNMKCNNWPVVVRPCWGYSSVPCDKNDAVVSSNGHITDEAIKYYE